MQESFEALILMDFPVPKPVVVSRLEVEEELGGPEPSECKEWETLRVAPADDASDADDADPQPPALHPPPPPTTPTPPPTPITPTPPPPKPHRCQQCGKAFTRSSNLNAHQRNHRHQTPRHPTTNPKSKRSQTGTPPPYRTTSRVKPRPYNCPECGKGFSYSSAFLKHRRAHGDGQQPNAHCCETCGKGFAGGAALRRHQRVHMG